MQEARVYNARVLKVEREFRGFLANRGGAARRARGTLGFCVVILLAAFALRFYHLGYKSLWGDEIAQATWSAWDWARLWEVFRAPPDFVSHFFLLHLVQQLGTSEFWVRLPSAVLSLAAVPLTYVVARRLTNRATARVAMLLMAVAPYQVWYAQDARMYAALGCYACVGLYFFLRVVGMKDEGPRRRNEGGRQQAAGRGRGDRGRRMGDGGWKSWDWVLGLGMVVGNTLALYTHLFGVFPILMEAVIGLGLLMGVWIQERRMVLPRPFVVVAASFVVSSLLALPLLSGTLPYVLAGGKPAVAESIAPSVPFHYTNAFAWGLLGDFGLGAGEFWRTLGSLALAVIGMGVLWFKKPGAGWVASVWILLPPLLLAVLQPRHGVAGRYLIFMQPVFLILIASGVVYLFYAIAGLRGLNMGRFPVGRRFSALNGLLVLLGFTGLLVVVAPPLDALYRRAKLNDWRAVARYVEEHAEAGDLLLGERNTPNMNALAYYLPNLLRYDTPPPTLENLQNGVSDNRRLWFVSVGEYFDKEGETWARAHLSVVPPAEWLEGDLDYTVSSGFIFTQSEGLATIYFHNGEIPSEVVYRGRQGFANEGVERLRVNPDETVEAKLQLRGEAARVLEMKFTSKKPVEFDVVVNGQVLGQVREKEPRRGEREMRWTLEGNDKVVAVQVRNVSKEIPLFLKGIALR